LFKIANSFGTDFGDKGYNYVKAEDVNKLFTTYVIIDKDDS
jgi:C1A family cysteine protease